MNNSALLKAGIFAAISLIPPLRILGLVVATIMVYDDISAEASND